MVKGELVDLFTKCTFLGVAGKIPTYALSSCAPTFILRVIHFVLYTN